MTFDHIAVVGAGAWGTALANAIARAGRPVLLATRDRAGADVLVKARESPRLPGVRLDERVGIAPLGAEVGLYDVILLAVPSQHLRAAAGAIAPTLREGTPVIACAKGIERGTHRFMTEVIAESARAALPAILSGPSFAADVAHVGGVIGPQCGRAERARQRRGHGLVAGSERDRGGEAARHVGGKARAGQDRRQRRARASGDHLGHEPVGAALDALGAGDDRRALAQRRGDRGGGRTQVL